MTHTRMAALRLATTLVAGLLLALLAPLSLHAQPAPTDEHMTMPRFPSGWIDHPVQSTDSIEVAEFTPRGQSPARWSEKITLEINAHSNTLPLDVFKGRALSQMRDHCDGVIERPLQSGLNNGYATAFWILGCKQDKSGTFGEIRYTKAVQGKDTLYLLSRTWRTKPYPKGTPPITAQQAEDAVAFLSTSMVCANGAQHPCPKEAAKRN